MRPVETQVPFVGKEADRLCLEGVPEGLIKAMCSLEGVHHINCNTKLSYRNQL